MGIFTYAIDPNTMGQILYSFCFVETSQLFETQIKTISRLSNIVLKAVHFFFFLRGFERLQFDHENESLHIQLLCSFFFPVDWKSNSSSCYQIRILPKVSNTSGTAPFPNAIITTRLHWKNEDRSWGRNLSNPGRV